MDKTPIEVAAEVAGGRTALARALGVTPSMVSQWCAGFRPVSPRHCIPIEEATRGSVTRYDLRPDVFGTQAKGFA